MSALAETGSPARELSAIVGEQNVAASDSSVAINGAFPALTVFPGSAEEVAAVLAFANTRGLVVAPAGGFTKQDIGGIPEQVDILLRTERLGGIQKYDPGDLTVSVSAGTPFAEVQRTLGEHHQWLPYDAANLERATVGGCVATAASGPLRHAFGGLRDFCIGVQFATADGKMGKGGGMVVKNVAGYDLMKLMTGSYGTLAVITRANFKVFPRPRQTRTFLCNFASLDETLRFRAKILASPLQPICLEILSPRTQDYLNDPQPARDPDDYAPAQPVSLASKIWQIALRATGSDTILARYKRELAGDASRELDGAAEEQFWRRISQFEYTILTRHQNAMVLYTHLPISGVGTVAQAVERIASDYNFIPAVLGRAATGNLIAAFMPLSVDPPSAMQYANCVSAFRGLLPTGAAAEVAHCPKEAKPHFDVWGTTPTDITMMKAVKKAIDPNNILNRGRFIV